MSNDVVPYISPDLAEYVERCGLPLSVVMHDDFGTLCYGIYTDVESQYRYGSSHALACYTCLRDAMLAECGLLLNTTA